MAEPETSRPATRFKEDAMSILINAAADEREKLTRQSEIADVWLVVAPGETLREAGWKCPVNLADCILTGHRIRDKPNAHQSESEEDEATKILEIVYPQPPREPNDIKFCFAWLEFYASEGEPPQIDPKATRSYLRRHLRVAQRLSVPALIDHLDARIQELTVEREHQQADSRDTAAEAQNSAQTQAHSAIVATAGLPVEPPRNQRRPSADDHLRRTHMYSISAIYGHESLATYVHGQPEGSPLQDQPRNGAPDNVLQTSPIEQQHDHPSRSRNSNNQQPSAVEEVGFNRGRNNDGDTSRQVEARSPDSMASDRANHSALATPELTRSSYSPANSAISRARSQVNGVTNGATVMSDLHNHHNGAINGDTMTDVHPSA